MSGGETYLSCCTGRDRRDPKSASENVVTGHSKRDHHLVITQPFGSDRDGWTLGLFG